MLKWMIKGRTLEEYLQACKEADVSNIQNDPVLMRMFNTEESYRAHLERICQIFDMHTGMRIVEIGGGYGYLARLIVERIKVGCYHIIDLPEVCELQRRYLKGLPVESFEQPTGKIYDLVISNYALSEILDNKLYIDEVLRMSKSGYVTCNTDYFKPDWETTRIPDIPGERETNYTLVW